MMGHKNKRNWKVIKPYVYIVYECAYEWGDPRNREIKGEIIHGLYTTRVSALGKALKLCTRPGYIAILKKPVHGKDMLTDVIGE